MPETKKQKNNVLAIGVGFFLIAVVVLITVIKGAPDNKTAAKPAPASGVKNVNKFLSISQKDLLDKISFGQPIKIIDIRSAESFASEHILDSLNYSSDLILADIGNFDPSGEYIIVDDFGLTPSAVQAISALSENDFSNVSYLEGGFSAWKENYNPTVALANPYSFADQSKVSYIKNDELKKAIDNGENIYIIDIRSPQKYELAHIKDAVNISLDELESKRKQIPIGQKIIIGGEDTISSFQGAVKLFDIGFTNVYASAEGFK